METCALESEPLDRTLKLRSHWRKATRKVRKVLKGLRCLHRDCQKRLLFPLSRRSRRQRPSCGGRLIEEPSTDKSVPPSTCKEHHSRQKTRKPSHRPHLSVLTPPKAPNTLRLALPWLEEGRVRNQSGTEGGGQKTNGCLASHPKMAEKIYFLAGLGDPGLPRRRGQWLK